MPRVKFYEHRYASRIGQCFLGAAKHQQLVSINVDFYVVWDEPCLGDKVVDGDAGTALGETFM
jgi:hypothetical protein